MSKALHWGGAGAGRAIISVREWIRIGDEQIARENAARSGDAQRFGR
jgi:hypothetical protein